MPEHGILMAPWRSGYAGVCKTSYTGSIPVGASPFVGKIHCGRAGIGRQATLRG